MGADLFVTRAQPKRQGTGWPDHVLDIPIGEVGQVERGSNDEIVVHGEYAIIHIQDTRNTKFQLEQSPEQSVKYHLFHCRTIEKMLRDGRFDRYVTTNRRDGQFQVQSREDNGCREDVLARLHCCKNCLERTDQAYQPPKSFDLDAYLQRNRGAVREGPIPHTKDTEGRSSDYPSNWREISKKTRMERGYQCEKCYVNLSEHKSLLHVHHRNGVKSDSRSSNLAVLCELCHSEQPGHSHMKVSAVNQREIIRLRSGYPFRRSA